MGVHGMQVCTNTEKHDMGAAQQVQQLVGAVTAICCVVSPSAQLGAGPGSCSSLVQVSLRLQSVLA